MVLTTPSADHHHVGIADPVRRRNQHLVTGVQKGHEDVEEGLFSAHRNNDVLGGAENVVVALEFVGHRRFEFGNAGGRGVFGKAVIEGLFGGLLDVIGCVEIGFARAKFEDIDPLFFEFDGLGVDGQRGGRPEILESFGYINCESIIVELYHRLNRFMEMEGFFWYNEK